MAKPPRLMNLDTRGFDAAAFIVQKFSREEGGKLLRKQASLLVNDLIRLTPPHQGKAPLSDRLSDHKKAGRAAVKRDVYRAFLPIEDMRIMKAGQGSEVGERLRTLALGQRGARSGKRQGALQVVRSKSNFNKREKGSKKNRINKRMDAINEILKNLKMPKAILRATARHHKKARGKRGRVNRKLSKSLRRVVVDKASVKKYVKKVQSHVGKAKAGWAAAVSKFNVTGRNFPKWISAHSTMGFAIDKTRGDIPNKEIIVGNQVAWAKDFKERDIIKTAIKLRTKKMQAQARIILEKKSKIWNKKRSVPGATIRVGRFGSSGSRGVTGNFRPFGSSGGFF